MLVEARLSWKHSVAEIWRPLLSFPLLAVIVVIINRFNHPFRYIAVPDLPISFLGAILGILLGFRINSAYGRWWEARTLWGGLVNQSRTLSRQAVTFVSETSAGQHSEAFSFTKTVVYQQIALVHALRCVLRKEQPWDAISPLLDPALLAKLQNESSIVTALLRANGDQVAGAANAGIISEWRFQRFDATLTEISNIQGGCERIKNTPLPRQYDFYPELFVRAYCVLIPICLVEELKLFTPFVTLLVCFVMLVLNRLGKNMEDPFENSLYDVPMSSLSRRIEIDLRQMLGEQELPSPVQPVDGVLW